MDNILLKEYLQDTHQHKLSLAKAKVVPSPNQKYHTTFWWINRSVNRLTNLKNTSNIVLRTSHHVSSVWKENIHNGKHESNWCTTQHCLEDFHHASCVWKKGIFAVGQTSPIYAHVKGVQTTWFLIYMKVETDDVPMGQVVDWLLGVCSNVRGSIQREKERPMIH